MGATARERPTPRATDEERAGTETGSPIPRDLRDAIFVVAVYAIVATVWIVFSDRAVAALGLSTAQMAEAQTAKGVAFVVATAALLFGLVRWYAHRLEASQARYRRAQDALHEQERSIRQAYIDVLDAVTGGKLILMVEDDLQAALGTPVLPPQTITDVAQLGEARHRIGEALDSLGVADADACLLAASEGLTNALKHGGGGAYAVMTTDGIAQVVVSDHGAGIDFQTLSKATLVPGFSTKPSLGMGFTIMLDVTDRLLLSTSGDGTTVVLEFPTQVRTAADEPASDPAKEVARL